jgi:prepilin-type N-terminal cleavage/methylation domain-containing protein
MIDTTFKNKGMTLVETIVSITILTIMSGVIFGTAQYFYQSQGFAAAQGDEVDNARRAVATLTQDLREMTQSENGIFPIAEIEPFLVGFYSDIDKDDTIEYVRYSLDSGGTDFFKRVYNPTGNPPVYNLSSPDEEILLSRFVQNRDQSIDIFTYYDSGHTVVSSAQLADVRYIEAEFIVNVDPIRSPGEFLLKTSVAPRNIKDNL